MRKLLALMVLGLGLASAQTMPSHTVTVNIPSILRLTLDATDYLFDFTDTTPLASVTIGGTPYPKASEAAYLAFLEGSATTQDFAPTSVAGAGGADYGTVTVLSNRASWTVKISTLTPFPTLPAGRVKVFAEKVSGKGASWTTVPTTVAPNTTLFNASGGGQGRSVYKLYYLFTADMNDDIPDGGLNEQMIVNLLITSP